jgi:hypothetical protein
MQLFSAQELYVCLPLAEESVETRRRKSFVLACLQGVAPLLERSMQVVIPPYVLQLLQASFTRWLGAVRTCGRLLVSLELCTDTDAANILRTTAIPGVNYG